MGSNAGVILVVDDDALNRLLLATSLEEQGYTVDVAEDGVATLEMLHDKTYDVVLLDLLMPEMDGYEVLERMRRDVELRHIPVIVISALEEMDSVIRCIEMGATDYLPKPFDPVLLRARINASLVNKRYRDMEQAYLKQIQRVSARLKVIFEGSAIGIALVDMEGRIVESNPALQRILESNEKILHDLVFSEVTHPDDEAVEKTLYRELVEGRRDHYQLEKRVMRQGGQLLWVSLTVSLVRDPEGAPQYGVAMVEDITAKKQLEEVKADFYSMVTHDLRNPVTTLLASAEMLSDEGFDPLTPNQQEFVSIIQLAGQKLYRLVNDYLDYAKIDAGYLRLEPGEVELGSLVQECVRLAALQAQARNQTLTLDLPAEPVHARVDAERLKQALDNLISNAVKYTPVGGEITLRLRTTEDEAVFAVSDTGSGIPSAHLPLLFAKYHRVPGEATRGIRGTGLGLLIVKEIAEAHGGAVQVESEGVPGKGSTFTIRIPRYAILPAGE